MKVSPNIFLRFSQQFTHFLYTPILGFAALIAMIKLAIYAYFLDVNEFGLLSKLLLISFFFSVAGSCGFQHLAQRDLPAEFAAGRYRKGIVILGKAGIVTSVTALAICFIPLFGFSLLGVPPLTFMFAVVHGWGQQIFMLVLIDSRSRLEMTRYSLQVLARTFLSFVTTVIVLMLGGDAISIVFSEMIITVLISAKIIRCSLHAAHLSISVFFRLSKKGYNQKEWYVSVVLLAGAVLSFLSVSVDRWFAANFLSGEDFGLYSFAWISLSAALSIQALLNAGFFPLLARKRVTESNKKVWHLTAIFSGGLLIIGLIAAFIANALAVWAIPIWYPKYVSTLPFFLPLLLAAAFRVSDFWSSFLIIIHRQKSLLVLQFLLILIPITYYWLSLMELSEVQHVPKNFALLALFLSAGNYIVTALMARATIT